MISDCKHRWQALDRYTTKCSRCQEYINTVSAVPMLNTANKCIDKLKADIEKLEAEVERLKLANENLQIDLALAKGDCTEIDWRSETDTALQPPKER